MKTTNNIFSCSLLLSNKDILKIIETTIDEAKGSYSILKKEQDVFKVNDQIIFIEEDLLSDSIFGNNHLCDIIESKSVFFIIIGNNKFFKRQPIEVKRISHKNVNTEMIKNIIEIWNDYKNKLNQREKILTKKLARLFYIYHILYEKESISASEIINIAKISKRTFQRDLKILKEVLVTKNIKLDPESQTYFLEDIFTKY